MATITKFEDLEIWQKARVICNEIETLFNETKLGSNYSLRNQMERSSGSIMDNIAEGFGRGGNREFVNFLSYSKGSANELKSQLYRSLDKKLITQDHIDKQFPLCDETINKIGSFMNYLIKTEFKGTKFKK